MPYSLNTNSKEGTINYILGDRVVAKKLTGRLSANIPGCLVKVPSKEVCLRCADGLFPSKNLTNCWEQIPPNWYSVTIGQGSESYLLVDFKFKEQTFS